MKSPRRGDDSVMARELRQNVRIGCALVAIALIPFAVFGLMLRDDLRLRDGEPATARVTEVLHRRESSKGPPETTELRIRFMTDGRDEISTTLRTTRRSVAAGDSVSITYDIDDPERVRAVDGPELAWRVPLILSLTVCFLAMCAFWIAFTLRIGRPSRYSRSARSRR